MNNWKKYTLAAVIAAAAGFVGLNNFHRYVPADFRDAPNDGAFSELQNISASEIPTPGGEVPAPAPVAVNAGGKSSDGIEIPEDDNKLAKDKLSRSNIMYPLRDCLDPNNNSTAVNAGSGCAESLMARAEEVKGHVLQMADVMKKLDAYTEIYYINPGKNITGESSLGTLVRHTREKLFPKSGDWEPSCESLGIDASPCEVLKVVGGAPDHPDAEMRSVVYVANMDGDTSRSLLAGTHLSGEYLPWYTSRMVYDPRKGELFRQNREALQSLDLDMGRPRERRYQFERNAGSHGVEAFRVTRELSMSNDRVGEFEERAILHPDGSLEYACRVFGVKMWRNMVRPERVTILTITSKEDRIVDYEVVFHIKNGRIVSANLEGLAGMVAIGRSQYYAGLPREYSTPPNVRESLSPNHPTRFNNGYRVHKP